MIIDTHTINSNNCHNVVDERIIEEQICTQHNTLHLNSAEISAIEHEIFFTNKHNNNAASISSNYNSQLKLVDAKNLKNADDFLIFSRTKEFAEILDDVSNDINSLAELAAPYVTEETKFKADMATIITKLKNIAIYDKDKIKDLISFLDSRIEKIKNIIHFFNLITAYNIYIDKEQASDIIDYLERIQYNSIQHDMSSFLSNIKCNLHNIDYTLREILKEIYLIKEIITNMLLSTTKEIIKNEKKTKPFKQSIDDFFCKMQAEEIIKKIVDTYGIDCTDENSMCSINTTTMNKLKNTAEIVVSSYNILMALTDEMFYKLIDIVKNHSGEELFTKGVSEKEISQSLISDITNFFVKPLNSILLSKNGETIDIGDILEINDSGLMIITKDSMAKLRFLIVQKLLRKKLQWIVGEVYTKHNSADFEQVIVAIGNSYFGIMDKNNLYTENNQINITFDNNTAVQLKHIKPELIEKNNLQKTSYIPLIVDALKNTENAIEIINFFKSDKIKNILLENLEFSEYLVEIILNKIAKSSDLKENLVELICNEIIAENKNILVSYSNYNIFMQTTLLEPILNKLLDKQIDITDILAQLEISQIASLSQQNSLKNLCDRALTLIDNADESKKKIADNFVKIHRELMKYGNSHIIPLIINTKLINSALGIITEDHNNELSICARYKNTESIKVILQENNKRSMPNKLDINKQNYDCDNALIISTRNKDIATLTEILKDNNLDVNLRDASEDTALMIAVLDNNAEIVKMLLEKNVNIDLRTSYHNTALMLAVEANHVEIVKILLEKNADVNLQGGIYDCTALMLATHYNYLTCVEILLNHHQTDINLLGNCDKTALMIALDNSSYSDMYMYDENYPTCLNKNNDDTKCVAILLNHQADINIQNAYGMTALILAAQNGKTACVEMLLNHQADINLQDKHGYTALMYAAENGCTECIKMLLEHKVDINLKNNNGETALDIAKKQKHTECITYLENHSCKRI